MNKQKLAYKKLGNVNLFDNEETRTSSTPWEILWRDFQQ